MCRQKDLTSDYLSLPDTNNVRLLYISFWKSQMFDTFPMPRLSALRMLKLAEWLQVADRSLGCRQISYIHDVIYIYSYIDMQPESSRI